MALWVCRQDGVAYAPGLPACPQCGSTDYQEDYMPNITSAGVFFEEGREPDGYVRPGSGDTPAAELPADRAPKADWAAHAVNVAGLSPEQAESMTKTELMQTVKAAAAPLTPES